MFEYKKTGNRAVVRDMITNQAWTFQDWEGIYKLVQDMNRKAVNDSIRNDFRKALDWYQSIEIKSKIPPVVKVGEVF
jgi:hypothetical protein